MCAQWGNSDVVSNSVSWAAETIQAGSGKADIAANNTALFQNTTPDAFISGMTIGQFGASKTEMQVTSGEGPKVHAPGWQLRRVGQGGIKGLTVTNGSNFVNGETLIVSGGTVNATLVLTTNATGNLVSAAVVSGGLFPNTSVLVYTYSHEKHLQNLTVTGGTTSYDNTDYIVVSNGTISAVSNVATNATGYMTNTSLASTLITNKGLFSNTTANADVVITVYAANGAASNGTGAVLVANLAASSGGTNTAPILGGRANRVTYEALAVVKKLSNGTADDAILPNS